MTDHSLKDLLDRITAIAKDAGQIILEVYGGEFEVEYKENESPLTLADKRAHETIARSLQSLEEQYPILSEEGAYIPFEERKKWTHYWLVDPLDGTKEFIKRNGEFTVNIALIEGHEVILGVVYAPVLDVTYSAARGMGAYKSEGNLERKLIRVARHQVGEAWRVVASRSHMSEETAKLVEGLGDADMVSMGSSLKLCLVAEGRAHLYPRLAPTSEWDTAAAQCVVEQAGGKVVTTDLNSLEYNSKSELLNPHFIVCYDVETAWTSHLLQ